MISAEELLKSEIPIIDKWLDDLLPAETEPPQTIHRAMRYSVLSGGKRLRPALAIIAFRRFGGEGDRIYPPACALELIHAYSLIHDDLPSMDNDDVRRGKPTNHKVFGEAIAILAGDALHALAFRNLAEAGDIRIVADVASAIGTRGLVGGQVFDLEAEDTEPTAEILEGIHRGKTAALIAVSLRMGARLAGADDEDVDAVSAYGEKIGLAFQIIDDILDITADPKKLGKPVGSDEEHNKATYPRLFGIERSRQIAEELIASAKASLGDDPNNEELHAVADFILRRAY